MLLLTSTSDLIQIITGSAVTTMHYHASYADFNGSAVTPGRLNTLSTAAETKTAVGSPGASVQRNVRTLSIFNSHATSSNLVTVQHTDGTTVSILARYTLLAGETLRYTEDGQFIVIMANGAVKVAPAVGPLLKVTVLTSASGTFTTGPGTNTINVRMQAAGGQGGGGLGGSSTASAGGGGAAGGYAEKVFSVTPSTGYSYTCGAGGSTSSGQATGQAGGNSTIVVGATTVTANGGPGGLGGAAAAATALVVLGGASPAVSTNGDLNDSGSPGAPGIRLSGTIAGSGAGGTSVMGSGANGVVTDVAGNSAASLGYGGGGGGACSLTAVNRNGGAGGNGAIIIEEYA